MFKTATLRTLIQHPLLPSFYLPMLVFSTGMQILGPIMPLYAAEFDVSYGLIGLVLASNSIGTMLGDIPAGMLLRRLNTKAAMLTGMLIYAGLITALFWVQSVWLVVAAQFIAGAGFSLYKVAQHAFISDAVQRGNRGRAISVMGGTVRVAGFAGPAVGGLIAGAFGLRAPFVLVGAVALLAAGIVFTRLENSATPPPADPVTARPLHEFWQTLRENYRILMTAGVGKIFVQIVRMGRTAIIPLYGADVLGLDVSQIGLIVSLSWAVDMSLFGVAGQLMDRMGRKYAIVPSFIIQAVAMALVPLSNNFWGLLAVTLLIGLGNGLSAGTMLTIGADLAPTERRGEFLGLWHLVGDLGGASGPLLVGGIADLLVLPMAALALAGSSVLAAVIFGHFVPETRAEPVPSPS